MIPVIYYVFIFENILYHRMSGRLRSLGGVLNSNACSFDLSVAVLFEQQGREFFSTGQTRRKRISRLQNKTERGTRQPVSLQTSSSGLDTVPGQSSGLQVVNKPALVVTRDVEWGQVLLGYEQANKYSIRDQDGQVVALLAEEHGGFGRTILRQVLRTRRGFTATVLSSDGSEVLFRLRRPPYLISSTMYIEDGYGNRVGEVQQEWRLLRRVYNLFIGQEQFARIDSPFLAWEFLMTDERGKPLALIDRNFSGFGKELFTDAGRYAIHFGETAQEASRFVQRSLDNAYPEQKSVSAPEASLGPETKAVIPCTTGNQLMVENPLEIDERMVALAAAISIDYDYFSRHSYGSGFLSPFIPVPMPMPVPIPDVPGDVPPSSSGTGGDQGAGDTGGQPIWEGDSDLSENQWDEPSSGTDNGWEEYDDFGEIESGESGGGSLFDILREWTEE